MLDTSAVLVSRGAGQQLPLSFSVGGPRLFIGSAAYL